MSSSAPRRSERNSCSALPVTHIINDANADQTSRPFRRCRTSSLSKLSQFFQNGNSIRERAGSLQSALLDLSVTGKLMKKLAETQRRGVESLALWAHNGDNSAIDDVMQQTRQLYQMFTERELQFAQQYSHYLQQLQKIEDAERAVKEAQLEVTELEGKERKVKREIRSGVSFFKQRRGGDVYLLRQKLEEIRTKREQAERSLSDLRAEMEVVKMFRFRNGMQGIADAYQNLAQSCQAIFNCHREIIEMVPAVSNQDVRRMIYNGTRVTRDRVEDLRRSLQQDLTVSENQIGSTTTSQASRRRSDPVRHVSHFQNTSPPPPYTPSAPLDQGDLSRLQNETNGYRTENGPSRTCHHCGQPLHQSASHQPKHLIGIEEVV